MSGHGHIPSHGAFANEPSSTPLVRVHSRSLPSLCVPTAPRAKYLYPNFSKRFQGKPKMVRKGGLEPPRVAPQDPKSCAYASSATFAYRKQLCHYQEKYQFTSIVSSDNEIDRILHLRPVMSSHAKDYKPSVWPPLILRTFVRSITVFPTETGNLQNRQKNCHAECKSLNWQNCNPAIRNIDKVHSLSPGGVIWQTPAEFCLTSTFFSRLCTNWSGAGRCWSYWWARVFS